MIEQHYIKGFNDGYTIAKYNFDLITKIIQNLQPIDEYLEGFFSGKEEFEIEHSLVQLKELNRLRNQSKDRAHDLGHG